MVKWYNDKMSGTYAISMGDRGRVVIPAELRERFELETGTPLVLLETDLGIVVATRDQMKKLLRAQLRGGSVVQELLDERRRAAADEDVA